MNFSGLKIYFQRLKADGLSSGFNLLSMVLTFLGLIVLVMYVHFEKSFDKHHENYNEIYIVKSGMYDEALPAPLSKALKDSVPEIEFITPMRLDMGRLYRESAEFDKNSIPINLVAAEPDFLKLFTHKVVLGPQDSLLTQIGEIVLTQKTAKSLYGDANPLGKTLEFNQLKMKVSAVIEDLPLTTSLPFEAIISFETMRVQNYYATNEWSEWSNLIFCSFHNGANPKEIARKIDKSAAIIEMASGQDYSSETFIFFQPFSEVHFTPSMAFTTSSSLLINVFIGLSLLLLLMGAFNYINHATGQASKAGKSLSIKQIAGAKRFQIQLQLLMESAVFSVFSMGFAILFYFLFARNIEVWFGIKGITLHGRGFMIAYLLLFSILFGLLCGIYPSIYLLSAKLTEAVKGSLRFSGKGENVRKIIITAQFVFALLIMIIAGFIYKQLQYWHNFDTGFNKENIVFVSTTKNIREQSEAFAGELIKSPTIIDYSYSSFVPGQVEMTWGREVDGQNITIVSWPVDERFVNFFGIEAVQGRIFSENGMADKNKFMINEAAVRTFSWDKPLDKKITGFSFEGEIVGISKDFNFAGLQQEIRPMLFWLTNQRKYKLLLKLSKGNTTEALNHLRSTWKAFETEEQIDIQFLEESLNKQYGQEERAARFVSVVAVWCVVLALIGLLGMIIFITRDQKKQIGIRRVNGATVGIIIGRFNLQFLRWIWIAFVITCPVVYFLVSAWLTNYAYKTTVSWWVFAAGGIIITLLASVLVSVQSYLIARRNPVESLRYE